MQPGQRVHGLSRVWTLPIRMRYTLPNCTIADPAAVSNRPRPWRDGTPHRWVDHLLLPLHSPVRGVIADSVFPTPASRPASQLKRLWSADLLLLSALTDANHHRTEAYGGLHSPVLSRIPDEPVRGLISS